MNKKIVGILLFGLIQTACANNHIIQNVVAETYNVSAIKNSKSIVKGHFNFCIQDEIKEGTNLYYTRILRVGPFHKMESKSIKIGRGYCESVDLFLTVDTSVVFYNEKIEAQILINLTSPDSGPEITSVQDVKDFIVDKEEI